MEDGRGNPLMILKSIWQKSRRVYHVNILCKLWFFIECILYFLLKGCGGAFRKCYSDSLGGIPKEWLQTGLIFFLDTVTMSVHLRYIANTENSKALQSLILYLWTKGLWNWTGWCGPWVIHSQQKDKCSLMAPCHRRKTHREALRGPAWLANISNSCIVDSNNKLHVFW